MTSAMEVLWKQAIKTFSGRRSVGYRLCQKNFEKLRLLMNDIRAEDVKIDKHILRLVEAQSAPMCVMDVFEDNDITIAIFLIKHGVTMPMHDHPGMHGLLKVISGAVKINSYTVQIREDYLIQPGEEIPGLKHPTVTVRDTDPACVLTPEDKNFHEISCVEGPAVFLDILSPPYILETRIPDIRLRPCTYFRELTNKEQCLRDDGETIEVQLIAANKPPEFYARSMRYPGPELR
ncbi:2-aminoethanethiol dioxygenase [Venturia canescens]|uniref:2-aminoethanethiol dioxygenase n=1 Tax=Venturia canescens TaxID=32260 RepID=UPI001C9BF0DA|nr:2-aminoethanethiol dioxygenase [Venturia canescens]